ncbi:MAG: threonine ammonia-lyase, biosynthetic, partial [Woeseiaceae bacterium]|nr:threonine ammonia-lyase, biosynthetic [Woeseiaceae bacterium]
GNRIWLKREDLQPIFSFKIRGAWNRINRLPAAQLEAGVICSSAGNHAQGVALAAERKNVRAVVVMPVTTPSIKVDAVARLGGEVILAGDNYDEAFAEALRRADAEGLTFIHPFDDADVIAGQGTIGREILEQSEAAIDAVFVPIGGGGLIAGIAAWIKSEQPSIRVIGVEPDDSNAMSAALAAGEPVTVDHVGIFADGVAVRRVGDETFRLCREFVDEIITVDTDQICAAVQDIYEDTRSIVEPAGALAVAGAKRYVEERNLRDRNLVALNCGANMNFDRLRHIAERAAIGEEREMLLAAEIPEQPGSFRRFCQAIGKRSITEFNYRYGGAETARVFVGVELKSGRAEREDILEDIRRAGVPVIDLSDNELAKLHIRHMVGGRSADIENERLFRFEFPERPGALLDFLDAIGTDWNISLFHYRNHGSDYGRVLAGIQVEAEDAAELEAHLSALGYPHAEESGNPAYRMFLA